jgi:hypothetical protein
MISFPFQTVRERFTGDHQGPQAPPDTPIAPAFAIRSPGLKKQPCLAKGWFSLLGVV